MKEEKTIFKVSDLYENKQVVPSVEVIVTVFNINDGHNKDLMNKCKDLMEYSKFVRISREFVTSKKYANTNLALDAAIVYSINNNIMKDVLLKFRQEVKEILLAEYTLENAIEAFDKEKNDIIIQLKAREEEIKLKNSELIEKDNKLAEKDTELIEKNNAIEIKDKQNEELRQEILELKRLLEEQKKSNKGK